MIKVTVSFWLGWLIVLDLTGVQAEVRASLRIGDSDSPLLPAGSRENGNN